MKYPASFAPWRSIAGVGKAHMSHLSQRDGTIIILRTFRFDLRRLPRCPPLQFQKEVLRQVGFPKAQRPEFFETGQVARTFQTEVIKNSCVTTKVGASRRHAAAAKPDPF